MHLPFLVLPCLYLTHILGKFGVAQLKVVQLIQAIYLLNKIQLRKISLQRSLYTWHTSCLVIRISICLLIINNSFSLTSEKRTNFPRQIPSER